ncbi:hypothetical protein D3C85_378180 [compost metagenome]
MLYTSQDEDKFILQLTHKQLGKLNAILSYVAGDKDVYSILCASSEYVSESGYEMVEFEQDEFGYQTMRITEQKSSHSNNPYEQLFAEYSKGCTRVSTPEEIFATLSKIESRNGETSIEYKFLDTKADTSVQYKFLSEPN